MLQGCSTMSGLSGAQRTQLNAYYQTCEAPFDGIVKPERWQQVHDKVSTRQDYVLSQWMCGHPLLLAFPQPLGSGVGDGIRDIAVATLSDRIAALTADHNLYIFRS